MPATEASGNGPDTAERAPLDARGWVPSVFRARPANDKESGRAMPATPGKKDRLTCAWGLQPKGRKDATREGQDDGSRRRRDDWTTASDGTRPKVAAAVAQPPRQESISRSRTPGRGRKFVRLVSYRPLAATLSHFYTSLFASPGAYSCSFRINAKARSPVAALQRSGSAGSPVCAFDTNETTASAT